MGEPERAETIAQFFDKSPPTFRHRSRRGFTTITGRYKGKPVSVISIGMVLLWLIAGTCYDGFHVARSARCDRWPSVCNPVLPKSNNRFGSCGSIGCAKVGDMVISSGSSLLSRNYDRFVSSTSTDGEQNDVFNYYNFSQVIPSDDLTTSLVIFYLTSQLKEEIARVFGTERVVKGLNISGDSFYSSQGRVDPQFIDHNHGIIGAIEQKYPEAVSLEMEVFMLLHLAMCSVPVGPPENKRPGIRAASTMVAFTLMAVGVC